ncbi:MAG: DNA gyrase modulator, partial [Pseudoruegeria sp.]
MSDGPFRPFEHNLDANSALRILCDATKGADDGELFLERRRSEVLSFDNGRLKTASYDASEGFGLRAVRGETTGFAHSTEMTESSLKRAAETAKLAVGDGGGTMAPAPKSTNRRLYSDESPITQKTFAGKVDTLREIDEFTRNLDPRVVQVSATIAASMQEIEILRPDGSLVRDARPMSRVNVSVIVEENGRRESGIQGGGGRAGLLGLIDPAHWQNAAR